jgi:MtN3 and saliva related transmembrane protein
VPELVDILGYAGTVTAFSFMVPQVYLTYKTKSVEDISWGMLFILLTNCILWWGYGFLLPSFPVVLANSIAFVVVVTQIVLKIRYRNNP